MCNISLWFQTADIQNFLVSTYLKLKTSVFCPIRI